MKQNPCPYCRGKLYVHGTCRRKVRDAEENCTVLRLRVLACRDCGKTHRELPEGVVPYKRYGSAAICQMKENPDDCDTESRSIRRITAWLTAFLSFAEKYLEGLKHTGFAVPELTGTALKLRLDYYVRTVVNTGEWKQHRSVMTDA